MATKYYHYSDATITKKEDIDFTKCENGFWATSISPEMLEEHGNEIGFNDASVIHEVVVNDDAECVLFGRQDTAKDEINAEQAEYGLSMNDNGEIEYEDVVFFDMKAIVSISVLNND